MQITRRPVRRGVEPMVRPDCASQGSNVHPHQRSSWCERWAEDARFITIVVGHRYDTFGHDCSPSSDGATVRASDGGFGATRPYLRHGARYPPASCRCARADSPPSSGRRRVKSVREDRVWSLVVAIASRDGRRAVLIERHFNEPHVVELEGQTESSDRRRRIE